VGNGSVRGREEFMQHWCLLFDVRLLGVVLRLGGRQRYWYGRSWGLDLLKSAYGKEVL